jgi:hypothetical protein
MAAWTTNCRQPLTCSSPGRIPILTAANPRPSNPSPPLSLPRPTTQSRPDQVPGSTAHLWQLQNNGTSVPPTAKPPSIDPATRTIQGLNHGSTEIQPCPPVSQPARSGSTKTHHRPSEPVCTRGHGENQHSRRLPELPPWPQAPAAWNGRRRSSPPRNRLLSATNLPLRGSTASFLTTPDQNLHLLPTPRSSSLHSLTTLPPRISAPKGP